MRLPSFRSDPAAAAPGADGVEAARTRARRRLVGALVLLVAGVIAFPLLFDTQPRPLSPETPIVMQGREPATLPRETVLPLREVARTPRAPEPVRAPASSAETAVVVEAPSVPAAGAASAAAAAASRVAPAAASAPIQAQASTPRAAPSVRPTAAAASAASAARNADDGARARALLEGQGPAAAVTGTAASASATQRFVVQVGAYTDAATLREARARVEKLGLKTYTQTIENDGGKRTRVRVGPFTTREEAAAAVGKLKAAGLPANVLAL